jgi:hypothetical protein
MKEQRSAYKTYIEKMILNLLLNYPDQNINNQFKPKKMLSYIKTDKTDVTLVCVFSVRSKKSIRIRTDAVSSFNSLRILPMMLSGPQVLCVLVLCRSFFTSGRDIGSVGFVAVEDVVYKTCIEKMILNLLLNYPDQNINNQFKPKKMLSYIKTDKTDVTPMRSDGQITADTKQNSNI